MLTNGGSADNVDDEDTDNISDHESENHERQDENEIAELVTVQAHDGENGENDKNLEDGIQDIRPEPGIPQLNEDDNESTDTAKYEYLHNGIAVGIVEICKDSKPDLLVHGKPLLDIQVKVQVIVNYNVNENDIQEFNDGVFLALSKHSGNFRVKLSIYDVIA